jgi:hypothetical protein
MIGAVDAAFPKAPLNRGLPKVLHGLRERREDSSRPRRWPLAMAAVELTTMGELP